MTSAGANTGSWHCHQEQQLGFLLPDPAGAADPTGGFPWLMQFPIRVIPRTPAEKMVQIYHPYAFLKEKSELKGPSLLALFTADCRGSVMLVIWERYLLSQ